MNLSRIGIWAMTLVFMGGLGTPWAQAQHRDDRDRYKQDVLKAVDRLMDKKLNEFKKELMQDIRRMLSQRSEARPHLRAAPRPPQPPARQRAVRKVQAKKARRVEGVEGPFVHVEGPGKTEAHSVTVTHGPDGKVHVRLVKDGKVIEKSFRPGDPGMHQWMRKMIPESFRMEFDDEGRGRVKLQAQRRRGRAQGRQGCCGHCGKKGFDFELPGLGKGKGRFKIEGIEKILPFGEDFEPGELGPWIRKLVEQWKEKGHGPEKIREFVKRFQGPRGRWEGGVRRPFERGREEVERFIRRKPEARVRRVRPPMEVEVEALEREKENLKRELKEIRKLLERLLERRRGR
ncbi:MAG: hypothetical protein ACYS47_01040 [Planctomycetota bacterium]|jgi:hypothetical protein